MSLFTLLSNPDTVMDLFEVVQTGIMVIDKDYKVLMANQGARKILGKNPDCLGNRITCHQLFFDMDNPCADCPLHDESKPWPKQKSAIFKRENGEDVYLKSFMVSWQEYFVLNINDVTREVKLLRQVDLTKKEAQAQNVLLKRRRQELSDERKLLEQILDHLPDALVTVSSSYAVQRRNRSVVDILPQGEGKRCYQLFGYEHPCDPCPAAQGFAALHDRKKSHIVGDRYFTEIITKAPSGDGGLLLFRDATRQIQLIEQIRETREAITQKNEILSGLVKFGAYMQKEEDPSKVLDFFLDLLLPVIKAESAAVILNDIREGNIWVTIQRGGDEEEMKGMTRAYLDRATQTGQGKIAESEYFPWSDGTQYDLIGANGRRVGVVVLPGRYDQDQEDLMKLFLEPLGVDIHNRLLMRQLEEKANTDPLTGLYNRGYLDRALKEEQEKLIKYNIPYAVVVADVNRLKQANDLYGHEAGDRLILTVSEMFSGVVRSTDTVARVGGDEFIILLTNSTAANADLLVKRLEEKVFAGATMDVGDNEQFQVRVSMGAVGSDSYPPETPTEILIKEADRLMYEAKEAYYKTQERYR